MCPREKPVCVYIDERGRRLGEAIVMDSEDKLELWFTIQGPYIGRQVGIARFALHERTNAVGGSRFSVDCPDCGRRRTKIVFKDGWSCRKCHGLLYRKQLVDSLTLLRERKETLERSIGKGRPSRMHQSTYAPLQAELAKLRKHLRGKVLSVANAEQNHLVSSRWCSVAEDVEELSSGELYEVRNGILVLKDRY
jgi:ribosomal protein L37AE/L43A